MKQAAVLAIGVTLGLSACSTPPIQTWGNDASIARTRVNCFDAGLCKVVVEVSDSECKIIKVTPDDMHVYRQNVIVRWEFKAGTKDYTFPSDGITFKSTQSELIDGKPIGNGQFYIWFDSNPVSSPPAKRTFDYTIKVERNGTSCTYDPAIVNQG